MNSAKNYAICVKDIKLVAKFNLPCLFFYLLCSCPAPTVTTLATSSHAQAQPSHHSNEAVVLLCVGKNIDVITVVNTEKKYRPSQMP